MGRLLVGHGYQRGGAGPACTGYFAEVLKLVVVNVPDRSAAKRGYVIISGLFLIPWKIRGLFYRPEPLWGHLWCRSPPEVPVGREYSQWLRPSNATRAPAGTIGIGTTPLSQAIARAGR